MIQTDKATLPELSWQIFYGLLRFAIVGLICYLAYRLVNVLVVFFLALVLTSALNPVVRNLQKRFTKGFSVTILVSSILVSIVGFLLLTIPPVVNQAGTLMVNVPKYNAQIEKSLGTFGLAFHRATAKWDKTTPAAAVEPQQLKTAGVEVLGFLTGLVTVLIMTTYLLADGASVATTLTGLFPRENRLMLRRFFGEISDQVGEYVRGQVITSALAGLFTAIFLWILGVPEPFALAGLMAVADAVPIVGIFIGTIPAILMALTVNPQTAIIVLIGYIVYHIVESYNLVPRIYGKMMKMPAIAILLSILIGSTLWGILGALFALPVAAAIPIVLRYWAEWSAQNDKE